MTNPIITLEQYLMGRDKLYPNEFTEEVKNNAILLLEKVNNLLFELNIQNVEISSGFRPSAINSATVGSAKRSLHQSALAIDIKDDQFQTLGNLIKNKSHLLFKYGLWMEDLDSTKGKYSNWLHLDLGIRKDRPIRIFKP